MRKVTRLLFLSFISLVVLVTLISCGDQNKPTGEVTSTEPTVEETPEVNKYIVTFDSDGGSSVDSVEVESGKKVPKPNDPTKEGYTFKGWYLGNDEWSFVGYVVTEDITLVAKWELIGSTGLEIEGTVLVEIGACTDKNIMIPNIITTIAYSAFYNCKYITNITIPNSVTKIEHYAFDGCDSLTNFYYNGTIEDWCNITFGSRESNPMYYADNFYILDNNGDIEYQGNKYTLLTELVIPNTVTKIDSYAFSNCSNLTRVVIPNSVTSIGEKAFFNCSRLTSIEIPDSVTSIGSDAFYNCDGLTSIAIPDSVTSIGSHAFSSCSNLTNIVIPDSVTSIGDGAFHACDNLRSITIPFVGATLNGTNNTNFGYIFSVSRYSDNNEDVPSGLKEVIITGGQSIGPSAFSGCSKLTSIEISNSVTSIGSDAFKNCSSLTSITIPNSVTSIGYEAFYFCRNLTSITIPFVGTTSNGTNNTHFGYIFGASSYSYNKTFVPNKLKEVIITGGQSIGPSAFSGCSKLTNIEIPNSVTSIGESAFSGCSSLTSIEIPNSVTGIGESTFSGCSNLTSIEIPNSVTSIGSYAFSGCDNLTSIEIPNSVTSTGSYAFSGCSNLTSIEIPNSVTSIEYAAFYNCSNLTSVVIPNSVTSIGSYAFSGCSNLTSIEILNSVTSIGSYAFSGCSNLTNIEIPNSVTSIGEGAFSRCDNLRSITIPFERAKLNEKTYTSFGYFFGSSSYFENDKNIPSSLKEVIITGGKSIGNYAFYNCSNLTSIVIGDSVTSIGNYAFYNCSNLTSITIPFIGNTLNGTSDTHFGYIFGASSYSYNKDYVPTSLKEVTITGGTSICSDAFYGCSSLTSIVIPDTVISIGYRALYNCRSLRSIEIPNSVTSIGECAFYECYNLRSITIPFVGATLNGTENTNFQYIFGGTSPANLKEVIITGGQSIGEKAFFNCSRLTSIEIPDSVTSIGDFAFSHCSSLTSIEIPNSVTSIGEWAFSNCSNLTSIEIPNSVTSIGECAFARCSNLTSITIPFVGTTSNETNNTKFYSIFFGTSDIPTNLKEVIITGGYSIGPSAFSDCSNITTITISNSVTNVGKSAFARCSNLENIVIPDSVRIIREKAFSDCSNLTNVYYNGTIEDWCNISFSDYYSNPMRYADNFYILDNNGDIEYQENKYTLLTELVIPNTVKRINNYAFYGCSNLTSIVIGNSVTSIGDYAFSSCSNLENVYYTGTEEEWNNITIGVSNSYLTSATITYNYKEE